MVKVAAIALLILGFVVAGNPSFVHAGMDTMTPDESMPGCPLMGMSAVCQMNPLEHLGMWQNLFTFLPHTETLLPLLISLAAGALGFSWLFRFLQTAPVDNLRRHLPRSYAPPPPLLQELFSNGILHSKAF